MFQLSAKIVSDDADWTSSGRQFQSRGLVSGKWAVTDSD